MSDAAALVRNYLALLESTDASPADLAAVLHPEALPAAFPHPFARPGRQPQLAAQAFNLEHIHTCPNDTVVVEASWWAEVGADAAPFTRGQQLTAHCCLVFEVHDGKIFRQRSYDGQ